MVHDYNWNLHDDTFLIILKLFFINFYNDNDCVIKFIMV